VGWWVCNEARCVCVSVRPPAVLLSTSPSYVGESTPSESERRDIARCFILACGGFVRSCPACAEREGRGTEIAESTSVRGSLSSSDLCE